ncbi:MAG TPA: mechanosensitive ion channel family protein [Xanthobacteraceae bacterium]|nr:mechanosensitive ion channel family protein [Xanthobacteraceae bacterium]
MDLEQIGPFLAWIPGWMVGAVLIAFATLVALFVHSVTMRLVRHVFGNHETFGPILLEQTRGPAKLALVILAGRFTVPLAPFDDTLSQWLGRLLTLAFIALIGWIAVRAVDIAAGLYMRRFRLDVEDNLIARKHVTQVHILRRAIKTLAVIITTAAALMTFDSVRQYGVSLFASAGAAGLIVGLAARPVLSNLIAGVQLAVTQPIRVDDAVIVENEWGWIEEITATYVVVRLWDWRRLVVPLSYFIEKPFQNWTREGAALIGSVIFHVDYTAPVARIRGELERIVKASALWDGQVVNLQVTELKDRTMELRALASARNAPNAWDLRCEIREKLVAFLQREAPAALPLTRANIALENADAPAAGAGRSDDGRRRARAPQGAAEDAH